MTLTQVQKAGLDEIALDHVFTIGASGTDHYTFQGEGLNGTVNDPTLYLTRGKTYRFENGTGAHAIRIQSADDGTSGTLYSTGVTNNNTTGTVIVEVQHDAPDVLYYQCASHANMKGTIYVTGALADDAITEPKIADNAVVTATILNGNVTTLKLADDAVTADKLANSINTEIAANTAKNTNATHTGDVTGSGSLTIASGAVNNAKVASDAAIAGTKIAPNFGSQNVATTGTISDSKGDVRNIPAIVKTSSHTLVAADAGKVVYISTGGVTVNPSVFSGDEAVTIINNSGSNQTITQGSSFTLYNTADAATGNRTLAGRGMCTLWFSSNSQAYISGAGLS